MLQHAPTYLRCPTKKPPRPTVSHRNPPRSSHDVGVIGSKRKPVLTGLELESTEARTYKNPQRKSIEESGSSRIFSELIL